MSASVAETHDAAQFRSAFEGAPIGMALVDITPERFGRYLMVNSALCELTGHSREVLEQKTFQEISHPASRLERSAAAWLVCPARRPGRARPSGSVSCPPARW
jgi:PAS domain S-box-containing protein